MQELENKKIPDFLLEKLEKQYGKELTNKIIDGYLNERIVSFRVNTIKSNKENIEKVLNNEKISYSKSEWNENAFIIKNCREDKIKELDIFKNGEIYLQSLSSMIPPFVLEPGENENILDMTAAPGGKTTQMAAMSENKALITACEKNKIRADRMKYNLEKQGARCVNVMIEDARKLSDYFSFDKILLDAPCSGSGTNGVFDKSFSIDLINRSARFQEELLRKALKILKKGNTMVYSTCSILAEENENILNKFRDIIEIIPIENDFVKFIPTLPVNLTGTICVCPSELYEGFFVAKIRKR